MNEDQADAGICAVCGQDRLAHAQGGNKVPAFHAAGHTFLPRRDEDAVRILVRYCPSDLTDGWNEEDAAVGAAHMDDYVARLHAALRAECPHARITIDEVDVTPFDPIVVTRPDGARSERQEAAVADAIADVWEEWQQALP